MKVELWVGVIPSWWSPVIWIPMKGDPEGGEAKEKGLKSSYIKLDETESPLAGRGLPDS